MVVLFYLWAAFKLWMLVDAMQRGVGYMWYPLIAFVPGGAIAYFVVEKAPSLGLRSPLDLFRRPVSTGALRYAYRENPCLENEVGLAGRLFDEGEHSQALELYQRALGRDGEYLRARYGTGLCQLALGNAREATTTFRQLLDQDRAYANYGVWLRLAEALEQMGDQAGAIEARESLVRANPRLDHVVGLGSALIEAGRESDAERLLRDAIEDFDHAPRHVRRMARPAAKQASKLLAKLA
jgi:tetratricopeptide (TPR) repeat protein